MEENHLGDASSQTAVVKATLRLMRDQPVHSRKLIVDTLSMFLRDPETLKYGEAALNSYIDEPEVELMDLMHRRDLNRQRSNTDLTTTNKLVEAALLTPPTNGKGGMWA